MTSRALLGMLAAALLVWGCASVSAPARFPRETITVPEESNVYSAAARPEGVVGGSTAARVQADLVAALRERGDHAEPDGALGATASRALREVHAGRPIDQLEDISALVLPSVQRIGIGARLHRTSKGTSLATVFMFEGDACK